MTNLRPMLKRSAATVAMTTPQARYDRAILVLSHMRAATTALSNVLCSHAQISGYGETHVAHASSTSPGQVLVNLALRRAYSPRKRFFLDKVLHNRLDAAAPPEFFRSRAIFMLRQPQPAIRSICKLALQTGMDDVNTVETAALYYAERVETLTQLWDGFAPDRRFGTTAEDLLNDPDGTISRLGDWLQLTPPLANRYVSHAATQKGGGGDPTRSAGLTRIERSAPRPDDATALPLPAALIQRCTAAFDGLAARFTH